MAEQQLPSSAPKAPSLSEDEEAAIRARRSKAGLPNCTELPRVGLAFSGGGIRSATYCLGVLRGMAKAGSLRRVDYLSTVSGGGYVGAMFSRLVQSVGLDRAMRALGNPNSLVLRWLRRNGRYLTPAGARDVGMGIATYLRSWISVQLEIGMLALLAGALVVLPHLLHFQWNWSWPPPQLELASAWWALGPAVWLLGGPMLISAYWAVRPSRQNRFSWALVDLFIALVMLSIAVFVFVFVSESLTTNADRGAGNRLAPVLTPTLIGLALTGISAGLVYGVLRNGLSSQTEVARRRYALTQGLRMVTLMGLILLTLGAFDAISWHLASWLSAAEPTSTWLAGAAAALAVLRVLAGPIQQLQQRQGGKSAWMARLPGLLGILLGALIGLLWLSALQWWVFFYEQGVPMALERWLCVVLLGLVWVLGTGGKLATVNASSMHPLYRARLVRAWLSIGNAKRFQRPNSSSSINPDDSIRDLDLDAIHSVSEVIDGDDVELCDHRPEVEGGPLHLINACLNQTFDDGTGLFNRDRKGCALTASARGLEIGRDGVLMPLDRSDEAPEAGLGLWTAVSGAAVAPGAGTRSSAGWAMGMFLLGVRLGYWMRLKRPGAARSETPRSTSLLSRLVRWQPKPGLLLSELRAQFLGPGSEWWYLSDGGHFDNTGVYPLLRRRLDFVVLADCGADPRWEFADLDNLIRLARIDLGVEIEFWDPTVAHGALLKSASSDAGLCLLSPTQVAARQGERGVMLAQIRYPDLGDGRGARQGSLLVLKPCLHRELDLDVQGYASSHPAFPQQSTGDQFFDEAQWESYQRLGEDIGRHLTPDWLSNLPGWQTVATDAGFRPLHAPITASEGVHKQPYTPRPWLNPSTGAAVGAGLGVGAFATLLITALPALEQLRQHVTSEERSQQERLEALWVYADSLPSPAKAPAQEHQLRRLRRLAEVAHPETRAAEVRRLVDRFEAYCKTVPDANVEAPCGSKRIVLYNEQRRRYWHSQCHRSDETLPAACVQPESWRSLEGLAWLRASLDAVRLSPMARIGGAERLTQTFADGHRPEMQIIQNQAVSQADAASAPATDSNPTATSVTPPTSSPVVPTEDDIRRDPLQCMIDANLVLYPHVYTRADAVALQRSIYGLESQGRTRLLAVEDVVESARRRGQSPPARWSQPTVIVHHAEHTACARQLVESLGPGTFNTDVQIRTLPAHLKGRAGVLELWVSPGSLDVESH